MPRSVRRLSAWYFGLSAFAPERSPLKPLQGALENTTSGRSPPAAARMSAGVASRQLAGGGFPWKAR